MIPTEVKDIKAFPQLKKIDRLTIAYAVLFGVDNQTAYALYHPEYLDASGKSMGSAGKQASRQFWGYGKVKDYREVYEQEIAEFFGRKRAVRSEASDIDDSRKDKALKALLNQAMSMVEGGADLDADTLKTVTEIFKKLNILKDDVEQIEAPRRYIPIRCGECNYRLFVESHIENGDIISECDYCRTRKFAEEQGWRFDPTKNLELPIKNEDTNE